MKKTLLLLSLISIVLFGCTAPAEEPADTSDEDEVISIGVIGPMAGELAWLGEGNANGAKLALEHFEAKYPESKGKYNLIIEDDQCDPTTAVNAYNKLKSSNVKAIVGGNCSGATLAVTPLALQDKVLMISPSATSPELTLASDYLFRTSPSDAFAGVTASNFMTKQGYAKVAINAKNDAWGQGLREVFKANFNGEVVMDEVHEAESSDFKSVITQLKSSGAEAIYAPTFPNEFQIFTKQLEELGVDLPILGGDSLNDNAVGKNYGNEWTNKIIFIASATNTDKYATDFNTAYKAKYGSEPATYASDSYDAMTIFLQAFNTVGSNPEDVKDYLYAVQNFPGASGTISFDENGDSVAKELAFFTYQNNVIVPYPATVEEAKSE